MKANPLSYMEPLEARLKAEAARLGFADCRITHADAIPDAADRLRNWLDAGSHGEMGWMSEQASAVRRKSSGARSARS